MKTKLIHFSAALLCAALTNVNAGIHVWSGAGGSAWNSDFNWSSGGKPTVGEAPPVILIFPPAGAKLSTNNVPGLLIDQMQVYGDNYRFGAAAGAVFTFNTNSPSVVSNGPSCHTTFNADVVLLGTATIDGSSFFDTVTFMGAISGAGGLRVLGGTTILAGATPNSFTGTTFVENSELQLSKSNGPAITGDLVIGNTFGNNNNEIVTYLRSHQVADVSAVTVKGTGLLDLNGFSDTFGALTLAGGEIETGAGLLTLGDNVTVEENADVSFIDGRLNLGSRSKTFTVASNAWFDVVATVSGGTNVGFGKNGLGAMTLSSSNSFSGPVTVSQGVLGLFDGQALGTTNYGTTVQSGAVLELLYTSLTTREVLTLNGSGANGRGALALGGPFDGIVFGNIVLASASTITVPTNRTLFLKGQVTGPGALHKGGEGKLWFDGGPANTFTGGTYVDAGELALGKGLNVVAIPGPLVIGDNIGSLESDVVRLLESGQINAGASVTVRSTGFLDVGNYTQTLGNLTMDGSAQVNIDNSGILNLPPLVTFTGDDALESANSPGMYTTPRISGEGRVHLLGPTTIDSSWVNNIDVRVSGGAGGHLIKIGDGSLGLNNSNTYAGLTIVKEGSLGAHNDHSLGSVASITIVTNSGVLEVAYHVEMSEALVLASDMQNDSGCALYSATTNVWKGSITLVSNSVIKASTAFGSGKFRIAGTISGPGQLIKQGIDPVELIGTNANTFGGGTFVHEGLLLLNKTNATALPGAVTVGDGTNSAAADEVRLLSANQIADSSILEVKRFGTLNLNGFTETVGSLQGAGTVSAGLGTLAAGGNNFTTTFSGAFNGVGFTSLIKQGTGTLLFTGTNGALGKTIVKGGKLFAHGVISSPVVVSNGATLGGNGSVGNVISTNGVLSPGAGAGLIETKGLVLDPGSSLHIELKGTNAGITFDQVNVAGAVALGNAALDATLEFGSVVSNKFTIIRNDGVDPVAGTFAGLPEGATTLLNGATFRVSYVGGDGNDVVLTQTTSLPQAMMRGAVCLPNGQMQVNGEGVAGSTYHVFANANLNTTNWVMIGTAVAPPNGQIQFTDTNAVSFPMRFYQFLLP